MTALKGETIINFFFIFQFKKSRNVYSFRIFTACLILVKLNKNKFYLKKTKQQLTFAFVLAGIAFGLKSTIFKHFFPPPLHSPHTSG